MSFISQLKERVLCAEEERDYYKSLVESFFSGETPDVPSLNHVILAQWGRKRIEQSKNIPALLIKQDAS